MSSKARSTVLFPEPESPVRITSWRASRLSICFTGRSRSVFNPALVGAGDAHIFAVFCDGTAGDGDTAPLGLFFGFFVCVGVGGGFFFSHFFFPVLLLVERQAPLLFGAPPLSVQQD